MNSLVKLFRSKTASAVFIILVFILAIFVSAGCGIFGKDDTQTTVTIDTTTISSEEAEQTDQKDVETEISIWAKLEPKEQIALLDSIDRFMQLNPDIKINSRQIRSEEELMDQFIAASLAGSGPEIVISNIGSAQKLAEANVLQEITDDQIFNGTLSGLQEISRYGENTYVIPFRAFNFLVLYYNKGLVEEVPLNFEDLIAYCKEVNDPGNDTWGFLLNSSEPDWTIPFIGGYQDWIYDYDNGSIYLETEGMKKTLEFLLTLYQEEKILPYNLQYDEINSAFLEGRAHMIINGNWAKEEYKNAGIDFGVAKIPVSLNGYKNPTPLVDGTGFMCNINCFGDRMEAGNRFIEYLMSPDIQNEWTGATDTFPVLEVIDQYLSPDSDALDYNMIQQLKLCRGNPPEEYIRVIRDAIKLNLENVILGNLSPEEAPAKMQEDAIKLKTGSLDLGDSAQSSETNSNN